MRYFLAIDIGASSGRHILGHVEDGKIRIDKALLKSVGISGSAVAVGDGKMVKLWNPEEFVTIDRSNF